MSTSRQARLRYLEATIERAQHARNIFLGTYNELKALVVPAVVAVSSRC